jgi:hypothetical protein
MNDTLIAARRPTTATFDLRRLALIAAVLPAAIATVNYGLAAWNSSRMADPSAVGLHFAWYVIQVGLVGVIVGRGIAWSWLRWLVFGWLLLLINLLAATAALDAGIRWRPEQSLPPGALLAGQMGLCVVWAFLGDTFWPIRWPVMIMAIAGLYFLWLGFGNQHTHKIWTELLLLQVLTLSVLCFWLWFFRFRLRQVELVHAETKASRRPLQFGIKHVLIWTTALAMLLGAAKAMDLLRWEVARELIRAGLVWKLSVATTSAIVIVVALWVALGQGHWIVRYGLGLLLTLLIGSGLATWSRFNAANLQALLNTGRRGWGWENWELMLWYEVGWWWLGWQLLCGGLLVATLLILRVLSYRLVRMRGGQP